LAGKDNMKMMSLITVYSKTKGGVSRIHQRKRVNTKQITKTKTAGFYWQGNMAYFLILH